MRLLWEREKRRHGTKPKGHQILKDEQKQSSQRTLGSRNLRRKENQESMGPHKLFKEFFKEEGLNTESSNEIRLKQCILDLATKESKVISMRIIPMGYWEQRLFGRC